MIFQGYLVPMMGNKMFCLFLLKYTVQSFDRNFIPIQEKILEFILHGCILFEFIDFLISDHRRSSVVCWNSCREEHLSHSFSLYNGEYYSRCTLKIYA